MKQQIRKMKISLRILYIKTYVNVAVWKSLSNSGKLRLLFKKARNCFKWVVREINAVMGEEY